jgi:hypothetical protein
MMDSLCALIALLQTTSHPFTVAPEIAEPERLALTPLLDGRIDQEEWDPLTAANGVETFFQWEPEKLHAAVKMPAASTMVVSLDLRNNGWLVGADNIEVRVKWLGDRPECKVRRLDATAKSGPAWVEAPMYQEAISCSATSENGIVTAELTLVDPGVGGLPTKGGDRLGVRIDALTEAEADVEPFHPRVIAGVKAAFERGSNVPGGLRWRPQIVSRAVAPGSKFKIRMTFNGGNELGLDRVEMRTEGLAQNDTAMKALPFPAFDPKGRAFVDYDTPVAPEAVDGYRVMRTTITDEHGQTAVLKTSYVIAPIVVFDLAAPGKIKSSDKEQKVRCSAYARSNTTRKVDGVLRIVQPEGWTVESGDDKRFTIYNAYGSVRRVFDLVIPAGVKGAFPVKLQADLGGKNYTQIAWITVS